MRCDDAVPKVTDWPGCDEMLMLEGPDRVFGWECKY
jgi:hypothetical protein